MRCDPHRRVDPGIEVRAIGIEQSLKKSP